MQKILYCWIQKCYFTHPGVSSSAKLQNPSGRRRDFGKAFGGFFFQSGVDLSYRHTQMGHRSHNQTQKIILFLPHILSLIFQFYCKNEQQMTLRFMLLNIVQKSTKKKQKHKCKESNSTECQCNKKTSFPLYGYVAGCSFRNDKKTFECLQGVCRVRMRNMN